jgi:hypothetical protein
MDGQPMTDVERPRSTTELIGATFELYQAYPWLFLLLAAVVVIPYELIDLMPELLPTRSARFWIGFPLSIADIALVLPLVSAFHAIAVDDLRAGRRPGFASVARRGIGTLPVVSAATVMSWLGITVGFVFLIVPGLYLWARWAVVAQVAALEDHSWDGALGRSEFLAGDNYRHILGLLIIVLAITAIPGIVISIIFGFHLTAASFIIRLPINVLGSSFSALAAALLYFELKSRSRRFGAPSVGRVPKPVALAPDGAQGRGEPTGHPLDPASYSDEGRPRGWFVDPVDPSHMRYWSGDGQFGWHPGPAKTPRKTLADWQAYKSVHPDPPPTPAGEANRSAPEPTGHPLDPDSYSDEERPPGWYVVPETPWKMRYWSGGNAATGWSARTSKTPKGALAGWYKISDR